MLLLHGKGGWAAGFQATAEHWRDRFDLYALDMRGRGFSDWAHDGDYTAEATIADTTEFVSLLGLGKLIVYGSSYGAVIGLGYAAAHPDKIAALILDDGGPISLPGGQPSPLNPGQAAPAGAPTPRPRPRQFSTWDQLVAWRDAKCRARCTDADLESEFVRTPAGVLERSDVLGLWASRRGGAIDDQWPAVDALRTPTLVLRAERGLLPEPITREMQRRNPLIRYVTVAGASHTVGATRAQDAYVAVEQFLAALGQMD
jgi:pimeloyl-ACP methyl ester carboxylesterase